MNNLLKNILVLLTITFNISQEARQSTFQLCPEIKPYLIEVTPQINDKGVITVEVNDYDNVMVILYENKLNIYHIKDGYSEIDGLKNLKSILQEEDAENFERYLSQKDFDNIQEKVKLDDVYCKQDNNLYINSAQDLEITSSAIESLHVELTAKCIEADVLLKNVKSLKLKSNNSSSLLSEIQCILNNGSEGKFATFMLADIDFEDDFMALLCIQISKVEIQFSFKNLYVYDNAIYFKS